MGKEKLTPKSRIGDMGQRLVEKYRHDPEHAIKVLDELVHLYSADPNAQEDIVFLQDLIYEVKRSIDHVKLKDEAEFRKEIIEFYIPKQLIDAIITNRGIPKDSIETLIGVGFLDVSDYTFLAKFLSAKENQILLNGLYTAFSTVLRKRGGYLNKIEGDSLMFHYGGLIDPAVKDLEPKPAALHISKMLFYTCVEMQRVCYQFNLADQTLLAALDDQESRDIVQAAFDIIGNMRNDAVFASSFNALFQIRIRIGANIGEVRIGNFGPPGRKHWDVIGVAVIDAKRMESTAPVGGLRISDTFYKLLEENGIVESYYGEFIKEASGIKGYFASMTREELFFSSKVVLKDKKNAEFPTYSVQVNPNLPEMIRDQARLLLDRGTVGAGKIVELIQYYRGNRYVIQAIEDLFVEVGVRLRKHRILHYMQPKAYRKIKERHAGDEARTRRFINKHFSLFELLQTLGKYQDSIKKSYAQAENPEQFANWDAYMAAQVGRINEMYKSSVRTTIHNTFFYNVVYPLVFKCIKASLLEFQTRHEAVEEIEMAEEAI